MLTFLEVTEKDQDFLYRLYKSTRADEFAPLGLADSQLEMLLRMQFAAQQRAYADQYPQADHSIIYKDDEMAGYLITSRTGNVFTLVYIALKPEVRNAGIGTRLIRQLQQSACESDGILKLQVLENSPARALYNRLGFVEKGAATPYIAMEWNRNESELKSYEQQ